MHSYSFESAYDSCQKADKGTGHETAYVNFEKLEHERENEFSCGICRKSDWSEFRKP
jgi:hypothetical protein